jgi:glutamyl-tRNA synthetase
MTMRLRFAPSPTGYLHVGGARTALFNWLYAKHHGGQFLLRIEDTDRARSTDESTRAIFDGLEWLGLSWDEDVVHQGANLARHQADARRLLENGHAYRCFCTPAELDEMRKAAEARKEAFRYDRRCYRLPADEVARRVAAGDSYVIRFLMPEGETAWDDLVHGTITFPNKDIGEGDFIILRSDSTPIYNMAVVSDDIAMRITLVMRGDDHISNTPKQILLYQALGAALPQFAHLPMIHGMDGKKLSKRHGATAVGDYQHMGILPEAMRNFLALLGWSPGNNLEIMTMEEMIARFSAEGLLKKAAVFDTTKLEWMNGHYLARRSAESLVPLVIDAAVREGRATREALETRHEWLEQLIDLLKVRARTVDEIVWHAVPFLQDAIDYDPVAVAKQWKDPSATAALLTAVRETLSQVTTWEPVLLEDTMRAFADARGLAAGKIFQPLRVALTGRGESPGIFDVLVVLGRERSLGRLDRATAQLREAGASPIAEKR